MMSDGPYPVIEKLLARAAKTHLTSTWLTPEEFRQLPHEIYSVMKEREALIDFANAKLKGDHESMALGDPVKEISDDRTS